MSGVINMVKDTLSSAKRLYTVLLIVIIAFVGYHFMYDFGLKAYKRYYGVEGFDTAETPDLEEQNVLNDATHNRAGVNSITTNDLQQVPTTDSSNKDASIGGMGNEVTKVYSPGNAIGNRDNKGVPSDSVASNASGSLDSPNLVYSIGNESAGLYPSNNNLNNIQGGNPQNVAGANTSMQPSPIAPISNDSASNENKMIAQKNMGIFDEDEKDASINVSLNIKMSEHVGKMIASSIPQYTNPQQYVSGRTTGILPQGSGHYGEMPVESLGTTYDNRLGGNYPSYDYNKNNNSGTAYTNMYKPVNPEAKPSAYNSLMDLFK